MTRSAEHGFTSYGRSVEHGFTLVELLVSLLIFGMLAAAGVALLSFSVNAQTAASQRLGEMATLRRISSLMTADLAQAVPRLTRNEAGDSTPAFTGNPGTSGDEPLLVFVRGGWSNLDGDARASLQKVEYRLVDGRLERLVYPMLDGAEPDAPAVLLDHIDRVEMRYRSEQGWRDRWDSLKPDEMPRAVEMKVRQEGQPEMLHLFLVGTPK